LALILLTSCFTVRSKNKIYNETIILNRKELKMNNVYIVKEKIDDTHEIIRAIFSTLEKATEYKTECVMKIGDLDMEYYFPIECWIVDYQEFIKN
jgi:hypothetical protein